MLKRLPARRPQLDRPILGASDEHVWSIAAGSHAVHWLRVRQEAP